MVNQHGVWRFDALGSMLRSNGTSTLPVGDTRSERGHRLCEACRSLVALSCGSVLRTGSSPLEASVDDITSGGNSSPSEVPCDPGRWNGPAGWGVRAGPKIPARSSSSEATRKVPADPSRLQTSRTSGRVYPVQERRQRGRRDV